MKNNPSRTDNDFKTIEPILGKIKIKKSLSNLITLVLLLLHNICNVIYLLN